MSRSHYSWLAACLLSSALASLSAAQVLGQVGNVQVGASFCGLAAMNLSQPYTCVEATVRCPMIEDRPVQLRLTKPPAGTPIRGTLVLGMGGAGRGFYESAGAPALPAAAMIDRLNLAGFRVIQRAWGDRPDGSRGGWFNGSVSLQDSACRYATLVDWIYGHPQLHDPSSQAFCASGQSGGASEISYGLASYSLEDQLDMAVLTGGPPHGAIDGGCDPSSVVWEDECNANLDLLGFCPQHAGVHDCFFTANSIERNIDSAFDLNAPPADMPCALADVPTLIDNSVLSPLADIDHPLTNVAILAGQDDCGTSLAMASPYILALLGSSTGLTSVSVVPGVTHTVPAFEAGAIAIEAALTAVDGCVLRH